jgi:hypothetical protein
MLACFKFRYGMEVHIVHYKKEYGTFENAQTYSDGVCVVGFFGEVIKTNLNIFLIKNTHNYNTHLEDKISKYVLHKR